jgi:hypothetical protein
MESGKKLTETTAGKEVSDRIAELKAEYKAEIDSLKLQVQQALASNDLEEHKRKLQEQSEAMENMERAQDAQKKLLEATIAQQATQIAELQNPGCIFL